MSGDEIKTNGCGAEGSFIDPPDFFPKACDEHDRDYGRGGAGEKERMRADSLFFENMNREVAKKPWYLNIALSLTAVPFYHVALRLFGRRRFTRKPPVEK